MRRAPFTLGAIAVLAALASCKKPAPAATDAAADIADAAPPPPPRVEPIDAGPTIVSLSEVMPEVKGPSWGGWYKCGGKGRLQLTHFETTVTGHASTGTEEKTYQCTISGDTCTGTEVDIHHGKGKAAAPKPRKLTLRRDSHGTIHSNAEGSGAQSCPKL